MTPPHATLQGLTPDDPLQGLTPDDPRLQFAQGFPAGTLRRKHLCQESPEGGPEAEESLPTTRAGIGWLEQRFANIVAEQPGQLPQGSLPYALGFSFQEGPRRTRRTAKEPAGQMWKKRSCSFHISSIYTGYMGVNSFWRC